VIIVIFPLLVKYSSIQVNMASWQSTFPPRNFGSDSVPPDHTNTSLDFIRYWTCDFWMSPKMDICFRYSYLETPFNTKQSQMGGRCTALFILELGAWRWRVIKFTPCQPNPPKSHPVPIIPEGCVSEPVWNGRETAPPSGFEPHTYQLLANRYTDYVHHLIKGIPENYCEQY